MKREDTGKIIFLTKSLHGWPYRLKTIEIYGAGKKTTQNVTYD